MSGTDMDSERPQIDRRAERKNGAVARHERLSGRFSIVPLLLGSRDISAATRRALVENRLRDAAFLLMDEHGLSCIEAGHLLDVPAC
jgi:hypothetical protein